MSTEMKSDIAFLKRQKELRKLYNEFRDAMSEMQNEGMPAMMSDEETAETEEEESEPEPEPIKNQEVFMILREIDGFQTEIKQLRSLCKKSNIPQRDTEKVQTRLSQLSLIFESLRRRAEAQL